MTKAKRIRASTYVNADMTHLFTLAARLGYTYPYGGQLQGNLSQLIQSINDALAEPRNMQSMENFLGYMLPVPGDGIQVTDEDDA